MKNVTINISLPKPLLDAADKQAETELRNRSELIREAVRDYLLKRGHEEPSDTFTQAEHKRLDRFISELDIERKWVVLSLAYRPQPNQVKEIFGGENSPVTKLVEHPGGFRRMGWDLETLDRARPTAGEYLQVKNGIRKILRVYRDGQVIFAGDQEFIGWAVNKDQENKVFSVNALAASEVITNFMRFGHDLSAYLDKDPSKMILIAGFHNPKKETVRLALVHRNIPFPESSNPEAVHGFTSEIIIPTAKEFSLEKESYKLMAEFFFLFGLREDEFWYVDKERKEVNFEFFKDR